MTNDTTKVQEIVKRRGGWFVTGESWSGPWKTKPAAEAAAQGDYSEAHRLEKLK